MAKNEKEIEVQKRTFTRWMNYHLSKREIKVKDIFSDLSDGLALINLLEVLTSKPTPRKYHKTPKLHIHQLENVEIALKFISLQAIKLVNIGPADIHQGRVAPTLGVIWSLIHRYSVSGSDSLLDWVNAQIKPYTSVDLATNFTTSWQDGKVLSALTDSIKKGLINVDKLENPEQDIKNAMQLAEEHFQIPQLVDAQDMLLHPDEHSNMTYIALFREYVVKEKKRRDDAKRSAKVDPNASYADGPGLKHAITGDKQAAQFKIFSCNEQGEAFPAKHARVTITDSEGRVVPGDVRPNADNTVFDVEFNPTTPGEHTITCFLEGTPIKDMPLKLVVKEGADATKTQKVAFLLSLRGHLPNGDEKKDGGDDWQVSITSEDSKAAIEVQTKDGGDGTYSASYNLEGAKGKWLLTARLNGNALPNTPFVHVKS